MGGRVGATSRFVLCDGEPVTEGTPHIAELVAIALCERALEGGAVLATLGVCLVLCLEPRLHTIRVERAVVVVDEVVLPKA
eukprot:6173469-Pleurochrysis_carterae.AAC.1